MDRHEPVVDKIVSMAVMPKVFKFVGYIFSYLCP
jgi:hypothetical protein